MAKTKTTNYYHPGIWMTIKIQNLADDIEAIELGQEGEDNHEEEKEHASYGLADSIKHSLEYTNILEDMITQDDFVAQASSRILNEWSKGTKSKQDPPQQSYNDSQNEIEIIFKRFYLNQSIESISDQELISEVKVKKIWNKFSSKLRTRNRINKKRLNKASRLEEHHKEAIQNYLEENKLKQFTLQSIKNNLSLQFPELMKISKPTISKWIKQDYSMRYKKLSKVNPGMISLQRKELTMEAIAILGTLETKGIEVIYIDEFTVSEKSYKPYGWSWVKQKGWKLMSSDNFCMGFIVGLSSELLYGVMGVKGTTTSTIFVSYLEELTKHIKSRNYFRESKYVLWWDNASYHKSEIVKQFLK